MSALWPHLAKNVLSHTSRCQNIANHEGQVCRQIICLTKSQVPALVCLDQFVYLGFFEKEKKCIVPCTFRCSTISDPCIKLLCATQFYIPEALMSRMSSMTHERLTAKRNPPGRRSPSAEGSSNN